MAYIPKFNPSLLPCIIREYSGIGTGTPVVEEFTSTLTEASEKVLVRLASQWQRRSVRHRSFAVSQNGMKAIKRALSCFKSKCQVMTLGQLNRMLDNFTAQYQFKTANGLDLTHLIVETGSMISTNIEFPVGTPILQCVHPSLQQMVNEMEFYKGEKQVIVISDDEILSGAETETMEMDYISYPIETEETLIIDTQKGWPHIINQKPIRYLIDDHRYNLKQMAGL